MPHIERGAAVRMGEKTGALQAQGPQAVDRLEEEEGPAFPRRRSPPRGRRELEVAAEVEGQPAEQLPGTVRRVVPRRHAGCREAVIVEAVRSPIGKHNGSLKDINPGDLLADVLRELVGRAGVDRARIEDNISLQEGRQADRP